MEQHLSLLSSISACRIESGAVEFLTDDSASPAPTRSYAAAFATAAELMFLPAIRPNTRQSMMATLPSRQPP